MSVRNMHYMIRLFLFVFFLASCITGREPKPERNWTATVEAEGLRMTVPATGRSALFQPHFTILIQSADPGLALRPGNVAGVRYNVATWENPALSEADQLEERQRDAAQFGDGFDARILDSKTALRTADVFRSGTTVEVAAKQVRMEDDEVVFDFPEHQDFTLSARVSLQDSLPFPRLTFEFVPKRAGYFSIGYTGAPTCAPDSAEAIWQPMLWQEKRFPHQSFLTLAYRCPLPTTLACREGHCVGVVADPVEYSFMPLPLADNSRFGVALRSKSGKAQPTLFAPVLGGQGSAMKPGDTYRFGSYLYFGAGSDTDAYENIARDIYQFEDYRSNALGPLNFALDNMLAYGMSEYSWFIDSLKGCAYSTDVPGAVKNVSALNPLQMALLTDREDIYSKRAYPIMEYLLSREKFLFSLDPEQKIQHPSRAMRGPVAPLSELTTLYQVTSQKSPVFLRLAEVEFGQTRARNLEKVERGDRWQNALALYEATGDRVYLEKAISGARDYLARRAQTYQKNFTAEETDYFFWTAFTNDWINLFRLFEESGEREFLVAAHQGARHYAQFVWLSPAIPDGDVLVNKGGKAPLYWYLAGKGHLPMAAPEEHVPAWRLSAIGLTPESSSTCNGHRGIFMTNYAPWMLRIAHYAGDDFLHDIARSAVIGRYTNFPGYHINTARTTAYEKPDYPMRPFKELSVNSFHFNHIWPHMSILVDFLVTDAFYKSNGAIDFPGDFIEGYAYLQSRFYGHKPGKFYQYEDAMLWMPPQLLTTSSGQLNYLSARCAEGLLVAFMNQSREPVSADIQLNEKLLNLEANRSYPLETLGDGQSREARKMSNGDFTVEVPAEGVTSVLVKDLLAPVTFQDQLQRTRAHDPWEVDYAEGTVGDSRALLLNMGRDLQTAYVYLREDDRKWRSVELHCKIDGRDTGQLIDPAYPYEFTLAIPKTAKEVAVRIRGTRTDGERETGNWMLLSK